MGHRHLSGYFHMKLYYGCWCETLFNCYASSGFYLGGLHVLSLKEHSESAFFSTVYGNRIGLKSVSERLDAGWLQCQLIHNLCCWSG